ncbi:hypothetical protein C7S14_2597 [Burkholderia cepacia]|nr:hypothetical protein C7S14_2597 [Burkholderia cepacia]
MHGVSDALPPTWKASPGFGRGWFFSSVSDAPAARARAGGPDPNPRARRPALSGAWRL